MTAQPPGWERGKVAEAVADARELIEAFAADAGSAGSYAEKLGDLMTVRLDSVRDPDDLRDRLAYILYGFTVFGLAATAAVAREGDVTLEEALRRVSADIDRSIFGRS